MTTPVRRAGAPGRCCRSWPHPITVAAAKAVAGEVAVEVSSANFELTGTSATDSQFGLDRHWRNARTHTLHDPVRCTELMAKISGALKDTVKVEHTLEDIVAGAFVMSAGGE